jgi:hypothetical protein
VDGERAPSLAARGSSCVFLFQDLGTTQRDMHLSPSTIVSTIQLLETTIEDPRFARGEIVEAAGKSG